VKIVLTFEGGVPSAFVVPGHDSRLGQVIDNLIENARSFSSQDGTVRITAKRLRNAVKSLSTMTAPASSPKRWSASSSVSTPTDRIRASARIRVWACSISRQIIEAHGGRIRAENRIGVSDGPDGPQVLGARFVMRLPAM